MKLFAYYSSPWLLWLGPKLVLIFDDPESIEGSDTEANTLSFLFLMLATFSDIQNLVYEELYDLYGLSDPKDVPITMEDIKKMKYLDRVIKETLRLFPPAPFIARKLYRYTKGQIFDMAEMKVIAASLLRKVTVRINDPVSLENVNIKFRITLQPTETKFLRFNKR
ncbi:cytochrome P450 4V2-like [Polistes fuscatus]|uniref:cytochrome P450 4V2-like n=1 Tax=Polistes fuscatus TaxID=30207 RepID=UPI001CA81572|nr:cytochrome P450 4V2-like [Polistes fuscatus]